MKQPPKQFHNVANTTITKSDRALVNEGWIGSGQSEPSLRPPVSISVKEDRQNCAWRVNACARREIVPPAELLVHRFSLTEWQQRLGGKRLTMLVNSENINNGTAGLVALPHVSGRAHEPLPSSHWFTILGNPAKGRYALLGFLTPIRHRTFLRLREDWIECGCHVENIIPSGKTFSSDLFVVREGSDPHQLLEQFGEECAHLLPARPPVPREVGWNSWDYYFSGFELSDLKENLAAIQRHNQSAARPVKNVVVDMGWYNNFGDWRANGRFPGGIAEAARLIREAGLTPGIWVSPYEVSYHTNAFMRTPEILATNLKGDVVSDDWAGGGTGWVDPTSPAGERFLFATFRDLHAAGFRYFKLDFLHYLITHPQAAERKFHNEQFGRMGIVRRGLEIIRQAIGEESYLLGCGCPPEAGIGLVDAMRIGGDISTYHNTVKLLAPFLAGRYWMNNRFFTNDPDFLMARGGATSRDKQLNPFHPVNLADMFGSRTGPVWNSMGEPRIWATLVAMAGGALTLADHLGRLNADGLRILSAAVDNASDDAACALDFMERAIPMFWLRGGTKPAFAIVNWEDRPATVRIPVKRWPALKDFLEGRDLWQGIRTERDAKGWVVRIPARDVVWFAGSSGGKKSGKGHPR